MAGTSLNDIKSRVKSVKSTMQITKAMELVAISKLRRAKERAENGRPFHKILRAAIDGLEGSGEIRSSIWSKSTEAKQTLVIVIAGDRGLAGGFNSNVFRISDDIAKNCATVFLPIGKKAVEHCTRTGEKIYFSEPYTDDISVGDALAAATKIAADYKAKKFDRVVAVYTHFTSMISQSAICEQILPLVASESNADVSMPSDPIYAGEPEEILEKIIPTYIGGILHSAVLESLASESAARRMAMNAANKNAEEIIDSLMLKYNRARQAVITQEITEIVSGSEAL